MTISAIPVAALGVPRIGPRRELKTALERFWSGAIDAAALAAAAAELRAANWARQRAHGVDILPSNDFSLYDHVLDTSVMVGAVPAAYGWDGGDVDPATYFAMARGAGPAAAAPCCGHDHGAAAAAAGAAAREGAGAGVPAQEMTKWFDTNYHFMVPELAPGQRFRLASLKPVDEYREARALGYDTRPVLLGPITFLKLAKTTAAGVDPLAFVDDLVAVYADVLTRLASAGATWVQIDEPCLVLDLDAATHAAVRRAYAALTRDVPAIRLMLATYFGGLGDALDLAVSLPVAGLHVDLVRAPEQLEAVVAKAPADLVLSLGVVDGRNVWRADLTALARRLESVVARRGAARLQLAPSCSLLHVPLDLALESDLAPDLGSWLAFAVEKMDELAALAAALSGDAAVAAPALAAASAALAARRASRKVHDGAVAARAAAVTPAMGHRAGPYAARAAAQRARFRLPLLPTTTIGSFPQTAAVRQARAAATRGTLDAAGYEAFLREETARAIRWQEDAGLDVLVHGEFERNDMVQYFGEQLAGFAFTRHGWVQSYGSRCVRPPILFGDVSRPRPMTVDRWRRAQSLTDRPVKGMLTGPVTILNWSFVRDDLPRAAVCRQIALALRDEVADLEAAGAAMIQIDEAALREGLPLRRAQARAYLDWAIAAFRLTTSGVADATQIHTHMCYSEFNDIIDAIAAMDADVISIECSRSKMELLAAFEAFRYPNEIGLGVYDIHSPRVPPVEEMAALLRAALTQIPPERLWVNPDCGLKTRGWPETRAAVANMVAAARLVRHDLAREGTR